MHGHLYVEPVIVLQIQGLIFEKKVWCLFADEPPPLPVFYTNNIKTKYNSILFCNSFKI